MRPPRTLLVWCPDWPVVAAEIVEGVPAHAPVAVLRANRVIACSEAARAAGVRRGLRKREAQGRCPRLRVVAHDPDRDARAFEQVVAAVEEVVAGVEVVRPGSCAVAARGPVRYFGGEEQAAERIVEHVAQSCAVECQVGIADGVFAAGLAARAGQLVPAGRTPEFLAGVDVAALDRPPLADLLRRLGLHTLGAFAALPAGDVLHRFGFDAAYAHSLAAGDETRPLAARRPPPDLDVTADYDEPLQRVDVAAFAARALAERLHERLAGYGLACTRLGIEAVTAHGQELHRVWRHDGLLTAAAIADRVRWQLDGWLSGTSRPTRADPDGTGWPNHAGPEGIVGTGRPDRAGTGRGEWSSRPTAGIIRLRLVPDGVLRHAGLQPGLWGDSGEGRERAHRALSRVQGILGPAAVVTAVLGGGRSPADQIRLVPWGDERAPARPGGLPPAPLGPDAGDAGVGPAPVWPAPVGPALVGPAPVGSARVGSAPVGPAPVGPDAGRGGLAVGAVVGSVGRGSLAGGAGAIGATANASTGGGGGGPTVSSRRGAVGSAAPPWPGRLPPPAPTAVLPEPMPATVYDTGGAPVVVSARLEVSAPPYRLVADAGPPAEITGWTGPWPVDERWWSRAEARRRARFQVSLADGRAMLLSLAAGRWSVEAIYD